jgi:hypothetical protein
LQHKEYQRRRRAIEQQLQEDLELIRTASQAKLRALEHLWLASAGEDPPDTASVTPAFVETQDSLNAPASVPQPDAGETLDAAPIVDASPIPPAAPASVRRRGDVLADIQEVFPRLPDVFDKSDVVRLLGYEPTRPSLHRVWSHLRRNGQIVIARYSDGRRPQVFRKV